jgi:hypothetical protein
MLVLTLAASLLSGIVRRLAPLSASEPTNESSEPQLAEHGDMSGQHGPMRAQNQSSLNIETRRDIITH